MKPLTFDRTLKQDLEHSADQMHVTTLCFVIGGPFLLFCYVLLGFYKGAAEKNCHFPIEKFTFVKTVFF